MGAGELAICDKAKRRKQKTGGALAICDKGAVAGGGVLNKTQWEQGETSLGYMKYNF